MQRELAFVQRVLAPHFGSSGGSGSSGSSGRGRCCCALAVAAATPVAPPHGILAQLQAAGHVLQPRVLGLLMQDASVLSAGALRACVHACRMQGREKGGGGK
jgi:hypothetical protein